MDKAVAVDAVNMSVLMREAVFSILQLNILQIRHKFEDVLKG